MKEIFVDGFLLFQSLFRDMLLPIVILVFAFAYVRILIYIYKKVR